MIQGPPLTPPFGLAVYVVKGVVRDEIPTSTISRGIGWFVIMDIITIIILMGFPQITLWLPNLVSGQ